MEGAIRSYQEFPNNIVAYATSWIWVSTPVAWSFVDGCCVPGAFADAPASGSAGVVYFLVITRSTAIVSLL